MARGWRGVAAGSLALVTLELLVQPSASGRVAGLFGLPGKWAQKFLDPTVPTFHIPGGKSSAPDYGPYNKTPQYTNPGGGAGSSGSDLLPKLLPGQGNAGTGLPTTASGTGPIYST